MKFFKPAVVSAMLLLVAFATMAPHFHTWDSTTFDRADEASIVSTEILSMDLSRNGTALHGDAEITLKFPDESPTGHLEYPATVRFTGKCVAPLCGGGLNDQVEMRGVIKIGEESDGVITRGQGKFSGLVTLTRDERTGEVTDFQGLGIFLRVRIGTFEARGK